jgi:uncharacterized protein (TIGR03503 family)
MSSTATSARAGAPASLSARTGSAAAPSSRMPDVRVLIDVSGSMKTTDPLNLRAPALRLLTSLAKPGSSMGVWSFGTDVVSTVNYGRVDDRWKSQATGKASGIRSDAALTQIGMALEHAANRLWTPDSAVERTIILLSDGKVDVGPDAAANEREQRRIFTYVVPRLRQGGYRVHAIALSRNADTGFLKRLADETGGPFSLALTADDLMKIFVKASDQVNKPLQVPLVGGDFRIDPLVKEFTALIYRKPGSKPAVLVSPSRKRIEAARAPESVKWFSDSHFDLVTVTKPENGQWKIEGDLDPDNRVTVVSNLDVWLSGLPEHALAGEKMIMEMSLTDRGKPLINPRFLSLMEIGFSQDGGSQRFSGTLSRDKSGATIVPADGIYRARLGRTLTEGDHVFKVTVDGKTFTRSIERHMTVHREALSVSVEDEFREGRQGKYVVMRPVVAVVDPEGLEITAKVADPSGNKVSREVQPNEAGQWRLDVAPGEKGIYRVFLDVRGNTREGNPFEVSQGPIEVDYSSAKTVSTSVKPESIDVLDSDLSTVGDESADDKASVEDAQAASPAEESTEPPPVAEPEPQGPSWIDHFAPGSSGFQWLMFILGNVVFLGGGIFMYLNYMQDSDEEQNRLLDDLVKIKDRNRVTMQSTPDLAYAPAVAAPAVMAMASASPDMPQVGIPPLMGNALSDAPLVKPGISEAPVLMSSGITVNIPVASNPSGPDRTYTIDADPLDLDDDGLVEIDDESDEADALGALLAAHAAGQGRIDDGGSEPASDGRRRDDTQPSMIDVGEEWVTLPDEDAVDLPEVPEPDAPTVAVTSAEPSLVAELANEFDPSSAEEMTVRMDAVEPEAGAMMMPMDDLESILAEQEALEAQFAAIESSLDGGAFAEDEFKLDNPGS